MRKVIFVGGTAFSGSTFFGMTLGNDPKGFSCGEVRNFLNPTRSRHATLTCGCGEKNCRIWQDVRDKGQENLYETIFELFPNVEFIVDSSKSPLWIRSQNKKLLKKGIQTKSILIWKTPLELAYSFQKRGRFKAWEKSWVNYHRLFCTMVDEWRAVKYREYTNDRSVLEKACKYLGIPYYQGKEHFWEKAHHVLGGNHSAKIHLYSTNSDGYKNIKTKVHKETIEGLKATHRSIYYHRVTDDTLQRDVKQRISNSSYIEEILELLSSYDISNTTVTQPRHSKQILAVPGQVVRAREVRQAIAYRIGRFRYERGG